MSEKHFKTFTISRPDGFFDMLAQSARFEVFGPARSVAILLEPRETNLDHIGLPIVRTTTSYEMPPQFFEQIHRDIAKDIIETSALPMQNISFNNAMMERYTTAYRTMKFHTDHTLDLAQNSYIALYSCYNMSDDSNQLRKLVIRDKVSQETSEITMHNNSVILFSTDSNQQHQHKIVLVDPKKGVKKESEWIGITFRLSKTWLYKIDGKFCFENGKPIYFASDEQIREFRRMKSEENELTDFSYPQIDFTISRSDLLAPMRYSASNSLPSSNSIESADRK